MTDPIVLGVRGNRTELCTTERKPSDRWMCLAAGELGNGGLVPSGVPRAIGAWITGINYPVRFRISAPRRCFVRDDRMRFLTKIVFPAISLLSVRPMERRSYDGRTGDERNEFTFVVQPGGRSRPQPDGTERGERGEPRADACGSCGRSLSKPTRWGLSG